MYIILQEREYKYIWQTALQIMQTDMMQIITQILKCQEGSQTMQLTLVLCQVWRATLKHTHYTQPAPVWQRWQWW